MNFFSSLQTGQPQHISRPSTEARHGESWVQPWAAPCPVANPSCRRFQTFFGHQGRSRG